MLLKDYLIDFFHKNEPTKATLISLLFILTLNFCCIETKSTDKEINQPEIAATSKSDTIKFTPDIHTFFQDSKGNYWFAMADGNLYTFNGKTVEKQL